MKNIILTFLVVFTFSCKAQSPIKSIEKKGINRIPGAYYKDLNNALDPFTGTWILTQGNTSLKIVLVKKIQSFFGSYYEDLIIGEYRYVKNGVERINTLPRLNMVLLSNRLHNISGNIIVTNPSYQNCTDCAPGEKRLDVGFMGYDELQQTIPGYMVVKKTIANGQEAIKVFIGYSRKVHVIGDDNPVLPDPIIAEGWYTLIKQP